MKIGVKKIIVYVIMCFVIIMAMAPKVQAAGLIIAFSKSTANVGDTITIKVTGNEVKGNVKLTVSGNATLKEDTVSLDNGPASVDLKVNGTGSIKVVATSVEDMQDSETGTPYSTGGTITVEGTSDSSNNTSTEKESSNANLSNLGIRPNDFSGFKPGTTTYNVTVPEDVESVEVYATAQDSAATVSGTGSQTLAYGENALSVVVTAEDGTTKTYTINVTREGEGEAETDGTEGGEEVAKGLSNITIDNLALSPSFKTDIYEYTVKYIGEDTSLDIQTVETDPSYTVEILGNEELKEGENTITILVADSEGNNVATYQLTVNKSLVDEEALAKEEQERQQQEQRKMIMIAGGIVVLILLIIIIIIIKRRRNRAYAEEFSGVPFAGINDEDDYYDGYNNDGYDNDNNDNQMDNYNTESVNEPNDILQKDDNDVASTEEINEENSQSKNTNLDFDDSEEKRKKEQAKRDFLEGYNSDYTDDYKEDKPRRGRRKGKRFK